MDNCLFQEAPLISRQENSSALAQQILNPCLMVLLEWVVVCLMLSACLCLVHPVDGLAFYSLSYLVNEAMHIVGGTQA